MLKKISNERKEDGTGLGSRGGHFAKRSAAVTRVQFINFKNRDRTIVKNSVHNNRSARPPQLLYFCCFQKLNAFVVSQNFGTKLLLHNCLDALQIFNQFILSSSCSSWKIPSLTSWILQQHQWSSQLSWWSH